MFLFRATQFRVAAAGPHQRARSAARSGREVHLPPRHENPRQLPEDRGDHLHPLGHHVRRRSQQN